MAQEPWADATDVRHFENPVGPRRSSRARPLGGLDHVIIGKDSCCT